MMQAVALFLSVILIGRACGVYDYDGKGEDKVQSVVTHWKEAQGVATPWKETQTTTPTLDLPRKVRSRGEVHVGKARIVGRQEPVTGKSETDWGFARREAMRAYTPNMTARSLSRELEIRNQILWIMGSVNKTTGQTAKAMDSPVQNLTSGNSSVPCCSNGDVSGCAKVNCERHEVCVYRGKAQKPTCIKRRSFRASKRHGHGGHNNSQVIRAKAKLVRNHNGTKGDVHHRSEKLKLRAQAFQDRHDQKFKISATSNKMTRLRSKKFVSDNNLENNTSDKSNKECRQKDLDGVGRHLLDLFKMNQDEDLDKQKTANKRRKEKRNSTKKELHEDDECICQAPVSWMFQHLDADADGHLSEKELLNLTARGVCTSRLISSCDHDGNAALSEKEWCCCFADILPPCLAALKSVPSILLRGQPMVITGSFVPQCDDDGFYSRVQCHSSTGECWCVDRNGKRISDATATTGSPDCAKSDAKMTSGPTSPVTRL